MKILQKDIKKYIIKYNINLKKVPLKWILYGINVELEHGKKISKMTNVTGDSLELTFKIALAHLIEFPDYYQRLKKMEQQAAKEWKNKDKNIFN